MKKISIIILSVLIVNILATGCKSQKAEENQNQTSNSTASMVSYVQPTAESTIPITTESHNTEASQLSASCDGVLSNGYDGNDYYELVYNKEEDFQSVKYTFGVIKNNEWLVEMSEKCPFISEEGYWKDNGYWKNSYKKRKNKKNLPGKVIYVGNGCFFYTSTKKAVDSPEVIYKPETGVYFELVNTYGHSIYGDSTNFDYSKIINENCEIIGQLRDGSNITEYVYLNMNTGEKKDIPLKRDHSITTTKIGLLSDGLFYTNSPSPGFYDLDGNLVIDFKKYNITNYGDRMFHGGEYTFTVVNESKTKFQLTVNTSGEVIREEKVS